MKIEIETTEDTIDIINRLLIGFLAADDGLSNKQSNSVEQFRRDMILPFMAEPERPSVYAFENGK